MYFIVNRSKNEVTIGDLNFTLGPNKAIDLEAVLGRTKIEASHDLKTAISKGFIHVRVNSASEKNQPAAAPSKVADDQIAKIQAAVSDEIKKQLAGLQQQPTGDIAKALAALTDLIKNQPQSQSPLPNFAPEKPKKKEDDDLDPEKLADIHAKSVGRLKQRSESSVNYNEKSVNNTASDRAAELENLP